MGATLLDRSRRPLVVTPAGQLYLEFCRDVLRRKERVRSGAGPAQAGRRRDRARGVHLFGGIERDGASWNRSSRGASPEASSGGRVFAAGESLRSGAGGRGRSRAGELSGAEPRDHRDSLAPGGNGAGERRRIILWPEKAAAIRGAIPAEDLNGVDFIGFDEELPIRREVDRFLREHRVEVNVPAALRQYADDQGSRGAPRGRQHHAGSASCATKSGRDAWSRFRSRRRNSVSAAGDHPPQEEALPAPVAQAFLDLLCEKPVPEAA